MGKFPLWTGLIALAAFSAGGYWWAQSRAVQPAPTGAAAVNTRVEGVGLPVNVSTVLAQQRDWPVMLTTTGMVSALSTVEVKAQVSSVVLRVHIHEGQFVKVGELLFTLDSRADEANVAKAQAQLERDQVALTDAQRQLTRSRDLFKQNFVSQSAIDSALTLVESQQAAVNADRAALTAARTNLSFNRIKAPAAGRTGAINVYAGSYVQPGATALVTITQLDPIAVSFMLPQRHLPDLLASLRAGNAPVRAQLPDRQDALIGRLRFVDNAVDPATGGVRMKAVFDNQPLQLWPGAYVNVQLTVQTLKAAIVIAQAAIVQGATHKTVFVVGKNNVVALRQIEVLAASGSEAVVSGLEAGARVVVEGKQNLRPGLRVSEHAT